MTYCYSRSQDHLLWIPWWCPVVQGSNCSSCCWSRTMLCSTWESMSDATTIRTSMNVRHDIIVGILLLSQVENLSLCWIVPRTSSIYLAPWALSQHQKHSPTNPHRIFCISRAAHSYWVGSKIYSPSHLWRILDSGISCTSYCTQFSGLCALVMELCVWGVGAGCFVLQGWQGCLCCFNLSEDPTYLWRSHRSRTWKPTSSNFWTSVFWVGPNRDTKIKTCSHHRSESLLQK